MRTLAILCIIGCFAPAAWACAVCYGDPNAPQTNAMNMAILFMLGVLGTIFGLLGAFFVHLRIRAKQVANENLGPRNTGPFVEVNVK